MKGGTGANLICVQKDAHFKLDDKDHSEIEFRLPLPTQDGPLKGRQYGTVILYNEGYATEPVDVPAATLESLQK